MELQNLNKGNYSKYTKMSGNVKLVYGYDTRETPEYYFEVWDTVKKEAGDQGLLEFQGTHETNLPNIVMAEKLKQFGCPAAHIQAVINRHPF